DHAAALGVERQLAYLVHGRPEPVALDRAGDPDARLRPAAALEVDGDEELGLADDALAAEHDARAAHHDGARRAGRPPPRDAIGEPGERGAAQRVGIRGCRRPASEQARELAPRPLDGARGARVETEGA